MPFLAGTTLLLLIGLAFLGIGNGVVFRMVADQIPASSVGTVTGVVGAVGGIGGFLLPIILSGGLGYWIIGALAVTLIGFQVRDALTISTKGA